MLLLKVAPPTTLQKGWRVAGGIRNYLNALVVAVLIPLLALALLLAVNFAGSERHIIEAQRSDVLSNVSLLVDREIESIESTLRVLAVSPALQLGQLEVFRQHLAAVLPHGEMLALVDAGGQVLLSSKPTDTRWLDTVAGNPSQISAGKMHVSGLIDAIGNSEPTFAVSVPVTGGAGPHRALVAVMSVERLNSLFSESELRPQWRAAIVDGQGRLLARNVGFDRFAGRLARPEAVAAAMASEKTGTFDNLSMDGIKTSNAFLRSQTTGWTVFVAVPEQILNAPLYRVYRFVALAGLGLTAMSLALAYLLSQWIGTAAHQLRTAALDVVEGRDVVPTNYPISEFAETAKVFKYTSAIAAQRKLDEQKLRASEERQRLALEAGSFATWDLDLTSGVAIWSPNMFALLGYPMNADMSSTHERWIARVHPDDLASTLAESEAARLGRTTGVSEYRILKADSGAVRWMRSNGQFFYDSEGTATRSVGVTRDVTERKLLELTTRENEARYKSALSVGRLASWETDFITGMRTWSPEAQELFGVSVPNGIGHVGGAGDELVAAIHPEDRHIMRKLRQLAQNQDTFPAEYRVVRKDGSIRWLSGRGEVFVRGADGSCQRMVSVMADVSEQKKAADHLRFLMREMSHRAKNLLAVIQSIARQTMQTSASKEEFQARFEQRIQGLAASHDILVDQNWEGATLSLLVRRQLAPFVDLNSPRLVVNGPHVDLNSTAAQAIGMALHELATNAVKFGAWSNATGQVTVAWAFEKTADKLWLVLNWEELGGPLVQTPARKGFGTAVVERMAPSSVAGEAALNYEPRGLVCRLTIALSSLNLDADVNL